ncbi:PaaX family transcriptional regulator C-terminal domain-containing protein [Subtercola boreus]|uniref:PaaX family transcriptional regulator C-terminal domain-containing protein n=1 Tax=Subtercola boreus TaxID=120213 RepID=UPI001558E1A1|nr:PaaX family transcriptional regulator C-terminal domain-containing protein [Subtercola boreus]
MLSLGLLHYSSLGADEDRSIASRCWNLDDLQQDYASFLERFAASLDLAGSAALEARVRLTDEYRHFPFRNPDLPHELLATDWIGQRAHDVFREAHQWFADEAEIERLTGQAVVPDPVALELFAR